MTDHTPPPADTRADATAAADRTETSPDGTEKPREAPIVVLQVEPDARSAELMEAFASRHTDRVRVRSVESWRPRSTRSKRASRSVASGSRSTAS